MRKYSTMERRKTIDQEHGVGNCSSIWKLCKASSKLIKKYASWRLSNGRKVNIQEDIILGRKNLGSYDQLNGLEQWMNDNQFLCLYDISYYDEKGRWKQWKDITLYDDLMCQQIVMKENLSGLDPTNKNDRYMRVWGSKIHNYLVKEVYQLQNDDQQDFPRNSLWNIIWKSVYVLKIKLFIWVLSHGKILTFFNLQQREFQGPSQCPHCSQAKESVIHLFFHCPFVAKVWNLTFENINRDLVIPNIWRGAIVTWHKNIKITLINNPLLKQVCKSLPYFIL